MTVKELIVFLEKQPQDLEVTYQCCSENCLLEEGSITIEEFCLPRDDGWVANKRPDKAVKKYLAFPGN